MGRKQPGRLYLAAALLLAFLFLSGALTQFTLARGLRIEPDFPDRGDYALRFEDRAPNPLGGAAVGWFVSIVLALGIVLFIVGVLRRESRLSTIVAAIVGICIGLLLIGIFRSPPPPDLDAVNQGLVEDEQEGTGVAETLDPEDAVQEDLGREEIPWTWTLIVGVPALIGIFLVLRPYMRRGSRAGEASALGQVAEDTANAIEAGTSLPDAIQRCYRDMLVIMERSRAVHRREAMTPREFEARLAREGVATDDIHGLTRLFEASRYGHDAASGEDEQRAVGYLRHIAAILGESA
jgi:hypothetical protein